MADNTSTPGVVAMVQGRITAFWNTRGESYNGSPGGGLITDAEHAAWAAALRDLLPAAPADVLDVGTGTGFIARLCADLGHRVTGIDPAEGMLTQAAAQNQGRANAPVYRAGDGHAPPFPPASFDAVINRNILWTLHDPATALARWYDLLRPGGRLVAIDTLWFAGGASDDQETRRQSWSALWLSYYTDAVRRSLPLIDAQSLDPLLAMVEATRFTDVRVTGIEAVEQVEQAIYPPQDRQYRPRFVIAARRP